MLQRRAMIARLAASMLGASALFAAAIPQVVHAGNPCCVVNTPTSCSSCLTMGGSLSGCHCSGPYTTICNGCTATLVNLTICNCTYNSGTVYGCSTGQC